MNTMVNAGVVVIKEKKVLLVQEAEEPFRKKWNFPIGKIENGESAINAAKREVYEETGCKVEVTNFLGTYHNISSEILTVFLIMFVGKQIGGDLRVNSNEILDAKWVTLEVLNHIPDKDLFHIEMRNAANKAFKNPSPLDDYKLF